MGRIIGVDIGGTFTDCIAIDESGTVTIGKAPSTPPDFQTGFVDALRETAKRLGLTLGELLRDADGIYHGCTVGTNALVEQRTAKVGLLTTRGHRDIIFGMQAGGRLTGMPPEYIAHVASQTKADPLVPKHLVEEIDERVTFDAEVLVELNEERSREAIQRLLDEGVEAFSVAFLWSIANPGHELRVGELIEEMAPGAFVSLSSEVIRRNGEYERTVATVVNSLIGPAMNDYLRDLERDLRDLGYDDQVHIMSCSGGLIDSAYARRLPLLTIGSGPVAGVIGAGALTRAEAAGGEAAADVITTDMGGTTFDVGVIRHGEPLSRPTTRYGQYEYFVPTLDVRSVGSGGGSIIHYDEDTATLRVGPQSAGARPGPAAYLRGGTDATVTDANLVLGYLNPEYFLGGDIALGTDASKEALERAGEPLGFSAAAAAAAAARIVDNQMADAIRLASVQQGYDPRGYVLHAYGGAGPVHATALARDLGMRRVVVPLSDLASGWSAFGIASSDVVVVEEVAQAMTHPFDPDELNASWSELEEKVRAVMVGQGVGVDALEWERIADMRYTHQINQVAVTAPDGVYDRAVADRLVGLFENEYQRLFGRDSGYSEAGFALTGLRVRARARVSDTGLAAREDVGVEAPLAPKGHRGVIWYERGLERQETPIYDGNAFVPGSFVEGPGIVEYVDTTLVLRAGDRAHVDALGSVVIDVA
ncbi:MAG: hydantoinase/oxoprolinase family protein [Solirubrobacteraceae bacterium]